jgi:iron complex outermembrane recepter protein
MSRRGLRSLRLTVAGALTLPLTIVGVWGSLVVAQTLPVPAAEGVGAGPAQPQTDLLEAVVVTARRRAESIQSTPISMTAFNSEALAQRQVTNIADVAKFTANVQFDSVTPIGGASNAASIYIRGIGQNEYTLTIDPGVGLYVDGVYMSRSLGSVLDTLDLERVEVLRGPQGSLFGKNTIGGAISLTTRKPGDVFAASLEGTTGAYGRHDVRASADLPVNARLHLGVSGSYQARDGYVTSLEDRSKYGNKNSLSGRFMAVYDPVDMLTLTLAADGTRIREETNGLVLLSVNPSALFPKINNTVIYPGTCSVPGSVTCYDSRWLTGDDYTNFNTGPRGSDIDVAGTSLTADWRAGATTLKLITAYRNVRTHFDRDADHAPVVITETVTDITQHQLSQEFQLSGRSFADRLTWVCGAFYMKEKGDDANFAFIPGGSFQSGGRVDNDSYAVFGQASYPIYGPLSVSIGARQSWDNKRFLPDQKILTMLPAAAALYPLNRVTGLPLQPGDPLLPSVQVARRFSQFTPSATVEYHFNDDVFAYASYSKGFKSGGFTQRVFPPDKATGSFDPETAKAHEIGLKATFLDHHVRWNNALFYTDYDNIQVTAIVPGGFAPQFQNAGRARIEGIESELTAAPRQGIEVDAGVGYIDAHYTRLTSAATATGLNLRDSLIDTPRWTTNLGVRVDLHEFAHGVLYSRLDWAFQSAMYRDAVNTPLCRTAAHHVVNPSVNFESPDTGWSGSVGVSNAADSHYLASCLAQSAGGYVEGSFSRPAEWYLRVQWKLLQRR